MPRQRITCMFIYLYMILTGSHFEIYNGYVHKNIESATAYSPLQANLLVWVSLCLVLDLKWWHHSEFPLPACKPNASPLMIISKIALNHRFHKKIEVGSDSCLQYHHNVCKNTCLTLDQVMTWIGQRQAIIWVKWGSDSCLSTKCG